MENLKLEGLIKKSYLVGDVMVDSLLHFSKIAQGKVDPLKRFNLTEKCYLLATVHRPINTDHPQNLRNIINAFKNSGEIIIFPVHPRTKKLIHNYGLIEPPNSSNLIFCEPLSYLEILLLEKYAKKILTDSGGIQKEAFLWGVPCITLREDTEWIETIEQGWSVLVGANYEKIVKAIRGFEPKKDRTFSYGDGHASEQIVSILEEK